LKAVVEKLAVVVFLAAFVGVILLTMLDGDPFGAWGRVTFAGLLLLILAVYGVSLSRLQRAKE
jgi:hypothetical protein